MNDINLILKDIMRSKKVTQTDIAKLFGTTPQAIWNKFNRRSWSWDEVIRVLEFMDCTILIESGDIVRYKP